MAKVHPWETCPQIAELAHTLLQAHSASQLCSAERSDFGGLSYQQFRAVGKIEEQAGRHLLPNVAELQVREGA